MGRVSDWFARPARELARLRNAKPAASRGGYLSPYTRISERQTQRDRVRHGPISLLALCNERDLAPLDSTS